MGKDDLQLEQDLDFERRDWRIERLGWILMLLIALAALLGLLGPGHLTRFEAQSPGGQLKADYYRFERKLTQSDIKLHVKDVDGDSRIRMWVSQEAMERLEIVQCVPEPLSVESLPDRYIYTFAISGEGDILARTEPDEMGSAHVQLGIEGGEQLSFKQFVWP